MNPELWNGNAGRLFAPVILFGVFLLWAWSIERDWIRREFTNPALKCFYRFCILCVRGRMILNDLRLPVLLCLSHLRFVMRMKRLSVLHLLSMSCLRLRFALRMGCFKAQYLVKMFLLEFLYGVRVLKKVLCAQGCGNDAEARPDECRRHDAFRKRDDVERTEQTSRCDCDKDDYESVNGECLGSYHITDACAKSPNI